MEEKENPNQIDRTSKEEKHKPKERLRLLTDYTQGYMGMKFTLGLDGFVTGIIYYNAGKEYCPWNPYLPEFLLTYGIIHLSSSALAWLLYKFDASLSKKAKIFYITFVHGVIHVIDAGLIILGIFLLHSPLEEVTYFEYDYEATGIYERNKNYCHRILYVVPTTIVRISVLLYTLFGLFLVFFSNLLCLMNFHKVLKENV